MESKELKGERERKNYYGEQKEFVREREKKRKRERVQRQDSEAARGRKKERMRWDKQGVRER